MYERPFEYVRKVVQPIRAQNRDRLRRERWWQLGRSGESFRSAVKHLRQFIGTSQVAKHRFFVWLPAEAMPANVVIAFTRDDYYFFGILHSYYHGIWALRTGTALEDRPRYTPSTTFETFPFPWPPGQEPTDDPRVQAIAAAAKELNDKREAWLNPPGLSETELKKRTLTNLYNQRPTWLDLLHKKLDAAVAAAYGWPADLTDEEILERLLALNLARAAQVQGDN